MKVLVINCGSSSLKFKLFDIEQSDTLLAKGLVEEIGRTQSRFRYSSHRMKNGENLTQQVTAENHTAAVDVVAKTLLDPEVGLFEDAIRVDVVGHRVVHGGEQFSKSALITTGVKKVIEACCDLAPLHNPPNLAGILACEHIFPGIPQVAVFDTAFHQTMPRKAFIYGLPYELYERYHIRKYGFHGTSHEYVSLRAAEILGKEITKLKMVTCHLGNGSSITAVKFGLSIDTSMGFTPLPGLVMGTRTGDMDPAVVLFLMEKEHLDLKAMNDLLNKKSGLKGISGVSNDLREVMESAQHGNARAHVAIDSMVYRITKYIGSYAAAMGAIDAIVFTGGIGENAAAIREKVLEPLAFMGVVLDPEKNDSNDREKAITTDDSPVKALVIPTNEELMIARKAKAIVEEAAG
ncbi:MAG: acetate kinase [Vicinamibacteria bacterium]|nr:acetate kinase [Vicinamibacteria bacterium]